LVPRLPGCAAPRLCPLAIRARLRSTTPTGASGTTSAPDPLSPNPSPLTPHPNPEQHRACRSRKHHRLRDPREGACNAGQPSGSSASVPLLHSPPGGESASRRDNREGACELLKCPVVCRSCRFADFESNPHPLRVDWEAGIWPWLAYRLPLLMCLVDFLPSTVAVGTAPTFGAGGLRSNPRPKRFSFARLFLARLVSFWRDFSDPSCFFLPCPAVLGLTRSALLPYWYQLCRGHMTYR